MPQESNNPGPEIVKSIFDRASKKSVSSLFTHKKPQQFMKDRAEKRIEAKSVFKREFPFGLDLGTDSIKIARLARDYDDSVRIANLIIEKLPKDADRDAKNKMRVVPDIVRKIVKENGLNEKCFVTAPPRSANVNLIKLPVMPRNEIAKALGWEMKRLSQQNNEDISWDYMVLENQKSRFLADKIGALTVTAAKKDIFEQLTALQSIGLEPLAIDIEALAALAAFDYTSKTLLEEVVIFLDFGASKTALHVICNRELVSTRAIAVTGNTLTKAISEYSKVPWEGAEALKKTFGITGFTKDQDPQELTKGESIQEPYDNKALQVKNAILPLLENIVQDIEHTFKYFSYQIAQSQITQYDRVILSGGSSYLKGFVPFLRNRLHVEVDIIDTFLPFGTPVKKGTNINTAILQDYGVDNADELSPVFNIAMGLALRGIE